MRLWLPFFLAGICLAQQPLAKNPTIGTDPKQKDIPVTQEQISANDGKAERGAVVINQYYSKPDDLNAGDSENHENHRTFMEVINTVSTALLALFTLLLAAVTGALCYIARLQWHTMVAHKQSLEAMAGHMESGLIETRKAADAARNTVQVMIDSERPWILVSKIRGPGMNWYAPNDPQYVPGMVFDFKVFGNKPVRITELKFLLRPIQAKSGTRRPQPDLPFTPDYGPSQLSVPADGQVIGPEQTFPINLVLDARLTEQEWEGLRDERTAMCAYGFIKYRDPFGKERETRVCYVWDFQRGGVFTSPDGTPLNPPGFGIGGPDEYNKVT